MTYPTGHNYLPLPTADARCAARDHYRFLRRHGYDVTTARGLTLTLVRRACATYAQTGETL